jgi:hypothetical protein
VRIPPRPIEVRHEDQWRAGTLRSWEVDITGEGSGVVTFTNDRDELEVGRFPASHLREPT